MGLGDPAVHLPSFLVAGEKTAALHQPQVFGRHGLRKSHASANSPTV